MLFKIQKENSTFRFIVSSCLQSWEEIIDLFTCSFFKASSTDIRAGNLLYHLLKVEQKQQCNPMTPQPGTIYTKFGPDLWDIGMAQDSSFHKLSYRKCTIKGWALHRGSSISKMLLCQKFQSGKGGTVHSLPEEMAKSWQTTSPHCSAKTASQNR